MNILNFQEAARIWLAQRVSELYKMDITPEVSEPERDDFGDITSNLPFQLSKIVKKAPRQISEEIILGNLPDIFEKAELAGAGYVNFWFAKKALYEMVCAILNEPENWGKCDIQNRKQIQIEFVSANPTGPLNIVSARAAAVGSTLANSLRSIGHNVVTEFYVNDAGNQIRLLSESFNMRIAQLKGDESASVPENGYQGEYLIDYAMEYLAESSTDSACSSPEDWIVRSILKEQKETLEQFRTRFDGWFSEKEFRNSNKVGEVLKRLNNSGYTYEKDGALWFSASKIRSDVEDYVLVKSDGEWAYGLADIAYHANKFEERGFDIVYTILGPDHHGHQARLESAMNALGHEGKLAVLILQQVNLIEAGEKVKMSKRAGKIITMNELINDVGTDAARYFFLARRMEAHLDFDLDLARKTTDENPIYYIQYAHARIRSILKFAQNKGISSHDILRADLSLLSEPEEISLVRKIAKFPESITSTARLLQPHIVPFYMLDLARLFHNFYAKHRVVDEAHSQATLARLALVNSVAETIKNGLGMCGISAPEQM